MAVFGLASRGREIFALEVNRARVTEDLLEPARPVNGSGPVFRVFPRDFFRNGNPGVRAVRAVQQLDVRALLAIDFRETVKRDRLPVAGAGEGEWGRQKRGKVQPGFRKRRSSLHGHSCKTYCD